MRLRHRSFEGNHTRNCGQSRQLLLDIPGWVAYPGIDMRRPHFSILVGLTLSIAAPAAEFRSEWQPRLERTWAGPAYWANPLQDWRISNGRLECIAPGGDRNVYLLTRDAAARPGTILMSVRLGRLEPDQQPLKLGFVGFRFGIRGSFRDYRDSAVRGLGINAGINADGRLFIGRVEEGAPRIAAPLRDVALRLRVEPAGNAYRATLEAQVAGGDTMRVVRDGIPARWTAGGVALVCHSGAFEPTPVGEPEVVETGWSGKRFTQRGGTFRFWFRDWRVDGTKIDAYEDRVFGPILFAMHTLSRNVLKLTAQMAPVGDEARRRVRLQIREAKGGWKDVASTTIDPLARTATFRIPGWDSTKDTPYRVLLNMADEGGKPVDYVWEGTIRKDPVTKPKIVVAAFTGNNDLGFPHADVVRNVSFHKPDFLVFTGDQIYERVGEYGTQRSPVETATLDYLRKWYLFGWEYRELLKDIPAVCLPDDHDVYHGNLWGAGGRHAEGEGYEGQDKGGYTMPAAFVNMVQRTQTSHHPDPYDPTPVEQGISVYYGPLLYGGVSFAVIEDRKWKSAPKPTLPKAQIINGWAQNPAYNPVTEGDAPGAELLGPRQEKFLAEWARDWSGGAWMKCVISQTLFANVATLPKEESNSDKITPKLKVMKPGEYAEGEIPVADHDSNGWPQTPRNRALRLMRKGFAFHISGDQHLGSTIQYGIDDWNDAGWAICVPSVANVWPRRWYPPAPGRNHKPGAPRYTGEYLDGFGNKITVHAVSNPTDVGIEPIEINRRAPGYGIVEFDRATRKITIANWPRWVEASKPGAKPYEGWPITIDQLDNGFPAKGPALAPIDTGRTDPVVEVVDQSTGEIVYTVRIRGSRFTPRVFKPGVYTVRVLDPDKGYAREYRDLKTR